MCEAREWAKEKEEEGEEEEGKYMSSKEFLQIGRRRGTRREQES